jgi:hypothetical protein
MDSEHHWRYELGPATDGSNRRVDDALTDLSAYALNLDLEYHRLDERLLELVDGESASDEVREVLRERTQLAEELKAYRAAVTAFRDQVLEGYATDQA